MSGEISTQSAARQWEAERLFGASYSLSALQLASDARELCSDVTDAMCATADPEPSR